MIAQPFQNKAQADHQQEAEAQNDDRGMPVHKLRQRARSQQHRQNGDDDGQHHDGEFLHHAYGRDD